MVVIHLKRSETDGFLYECRTTDSNDAVIRELVRGRFIPLRTAGCAAAASIDANAGRQPTTNRHVVRFAPPCRSAASTTCARSCRG